MLLLQVITVLLLQVITVLLLQVITVLMLQVIAHGVIVAAAAACRQAVRRRAS